MRKYFYYLIILLIIPIYGQDMYWHTFGSGGYLDNEKGSTLGQSFTADFSTSDSTGITYGYWFSDWIPTIECSLSSFHWYVSDIPTWPDTTELTEIINMVDSDVIRIFNLGNCYIDYGIVYESTSVDSLTCGYSSGYNRFRICSRFSESESPPITYSIANDHIKNTWTWSTNEILGEAGFNCSPESVNYLWMQFSAPNYVYSGGEITVYLKLGMKLTLP